MQNPKTYFIQRDGAEIGPFNIQQLNRMRAKNEIAATDLCRAADSTQFHPLVALFPHMGAFTHKSPEEHKKLARIWEGNVDAHAALVCGILSFVIATLPMGIAA